MVAENGRRSERLRADYDPITGKGVEEFDGRPRVLLQIKDFAIKQQWVPAPMVFDPLVQEIIAAGSIRKFIRTHKWPDEAPTHDDIERELRKVRHQYDFVFWAYFCIRIRYKTGGRGRWTLNYAQFQVLRQCEEMRLAGVPINLIIDKARQWGGSTFCIFYQFWIAVKWDPYHSFSVAAHVNDASRRILNMLKEAITDYPAWDLGLPVGAKLHLAPHEGSSHDFVVKDQNDEIVLPAIINVGSAERPDSLRSANLSGAHYSEIGVWPDTPEKRPEDLVADISGGIAKHRALSMQVFESTAKSTDDYFHEICMDAVNGRSNFKCIFIPFYFIPHDTIEVKDQKAFARWLLENKEMDTPLPGWKSSGRYYWWLWTEGASFESINWYRYEELGFTKRSQMVNEAPASLEESFMSSGQKVFDFFDVQRMMHRCRAPRWEGELISEGDTGKGVITNVSFYPVAGGKVKVWERPDPSPMRYRYVVAVDIGGANPTSDFSSIRVLDRLMMMPQFGLDGRPGVVAEIHYHADHDRVAYDAARLAAWYNNALLVIESNTLETKDKERDTGGDGFEYILDIVSEFYPNLYARRNKEEDFGDKIVRKWGFHTNTSTKPKIIDNMRACVRDSLWDEPCKNCCEEISMYIDDHGKFTAPPKKHDDELMATAILLWIAFKEMPLPEFIIEGDTYKAAGPTYHKGDNSNITKF